MGRPEKKNVDYFPHFIADGKKMFYIERKYGNDGYATWFKILEILAKTDNHWINLNEKTELMYVSSKCLIEEETLLNILEDLAILGQINQELWSSKIVWSDKFTESVEDAYLKRNNKCWSLSDLREHLLSLGILKGSIKPQSKVKEIKEKESKVERGKRFAPPTQEEVRDYFYEQLPRTQWAIDESKKFVDFYASKNWMVGKNKMKDWRAAVRNWIRRMDEQPGQGMPNRYDPKYERTLQGNEISQYHRHLISLGWQKMYNSGGTSWKAP